MEMGKGTVKLDQKLRYLVLFIKPDLKAKKKNEKSVLAVGT